MGCGIPLLAKDGRNGAPGTRQKAGPSTLHDPPSEDHAALGMTGWGRESADRSVGPREVGQILCLAHIHALKAERQAVVMGEGACAAGKSENHHKKNKEAARGVFWARREDRDERAED